MNCDICDKEDVGDYLSYYTKVDENGLPKDDAKPDIVVCTKHAKTSQGRKAIRRRLNAA